MKLFERDEPEVKPALEVKAAAETMRKDDAPMEKQAEDKPATAPASST